MDDSNTPFYKKIFTNLSPLEAGVIGAIIVVFAIVLQVFLNLGKNVPLSITQKTPPIPAGKQVIVTGDIVCVGKSEEAECELGLKTDKGTYILENVDDKVMADFFASLGKTVELSGVIIETTPAVQNSQNSTGSSGSGGTNGSSSSGGSSVGGANGTLYVIPSPTPTSSGISLFGGSQSPTPNPLTPTPQGNYSGIYGTVKYIIDHKDELKGKNVDVSAFLIDGRVGNNFCQIINPCDHWELVLGDLLTDDLGNNYWIKVHISKSETENNYTLGDTVSLKGRVVVKDNQVYLIKQY